MKKEILIISGFLLVAGTIGVCSYAMVQNQKIMIANQYAIIKQMNEKAVQQKLNNELTAQEQLNRTPIGFKQTTTV